MGYSAAKMYRSMKEKQEECDHPAKKAVGIASGIYCGVCSMELVVKHEEVKDKNE